MKTKIIFILIAFSTVGFSQTTSTLFFQEGDRICFVGNSITNMGDFHHNILLYHVTRFPDQEITVYNAGISGNVTESILARMDDDILIHKPTVAVIMIGMNDIKRNLYSPYIISNKDTLQLREQAISLYKTNLEKIVNIFISNNIRVILQKPSICDQTAIIPETNHLGSNDALKTCADFMETLCVKYKLQSVDYWTIMNNLNTEMQKKDPTFTIVGRDRVHPGPTGNLVMAYQFLTTEGAPQYVSKMVIAEDVKNSNSKSLNCELKALRKDKNGLSFTVNEKSLPFPTVEAQKAGLELVPFNKKLNQEILQIVGMKSGQYELTIDGKTIGNFSKDQFSTGIDLAQFAETPQYRQALKVRETLAKLWKLEEKLRYIKIIEYGWEYKAFPNKQNFEAIKAYLLPIYKSKNREVYMLQINGYLENKPKESELIANSDQLRKEAYELAQPVEHKYEIRKK